MKTLNSSNISHLEEGNQLGKCICSVEYGKVTYKGVTYWNVKEMMKGDTK
jgi:hypothetical protein